MFIGLMCTNYDQDSSMHRIKIISYKSPSTAFVVGCSLNDISSKMQPYRAVIAPIVRSPIWPYWYGSWKGSFMVHIKGSALHSVWGSCSHKMSKSKTNAPVIPHHLLMQNVHLDLLSTINLVSTMDLNSFDKKDPPNIRLNAATQFFHHPTSQY